MTTQYENEAKNLLVELQEYVVEIDKFKLNLLSPKYREGYFKNMVKECKKNSGKIFCALSGSKVVGVIAGYVERYCKKDLLVYSCPKKGIVAELIVSKNSRKEGAGKLLLNKMEEYFKLLLNKMEEYFKSIGCSFIQLDVMEDNTPAKKFYYSNGYEKRMLTLFKKIQ